jgi:hypothetical protein
MSRVLHIQRPRRKKSPIGLWMRKLQAYRFVPVVSQSLLTTYFFTMHILCISDMLLYIRLASDVTGIFDISMMIDDRRLAFSYGPFLTRRRDVPT